MGKWGLPINPNKCSCLTVGHLLFIQILQVTDVRDLELPLDTTFTGSAHCRGAANTTRRLLFMVRRSFCELAKTVFIPLYCALVRSHLEYAMEANAPTLRANTNQLEWVQCLATRLVRGQVPNKERSSWSSKLSKVKLTFTLLTSSSAHREIVYESTPTDYCTDQAVFDAVPFQFRS